MSMRGDVAALYGALLDAPALSPLRTPSLPLRRRASPRYWFNSPLHAATRRRSIPHDASFLAAAGFVCLSTRMPATRLFTTHFTRFCRGVLILYLPQTLPCLLPKAGGAAAYFCTRERRGELRNGSTHFILPYCLHSRPSTTHTNTTLLFPAAYRC